MTASGSGTGSFLVRRKASRIWLATRLQHERFDPEAFAAEQALHRLGDGTVVVRDVLAGQYGPHVGALAAQEKRPLAHALQIEVGHGCFHLGRQPTVVGRRNAESFAELAGRQLRKDIRFRCRSPVHGHQLPVLTDQQAGSRQLPVPLAAVIVDDTRRHLVPRHCVALHWSLLLRRSERFWQEGYGAVVKPRRMHVLPEAAGERC